MSLEVKLEKYTEKNNCDVKDTLFQNLEKKQIKTITEKMTETDVKEIEI